MSAFGVVDVIERVDLRLQLSEVAGDGLLVEVAERGLRPLHEARPCQSADALTRISTLPPYWGEDLSSQARVREYFAPPDAVRSFSAVPNT